MKNKMKQAAAFLLAFSAAVSFPLTAFAHPGRTDSKGGHRDNKNVSGLGHYHYHCGENPAHLHEGGVCPYGGKSAVSSDSGTSSSGSSGSGSSSAGIGSSVKKADWHWQKDESGHWRYTDGNGNYKKGWLSLNDTWYYLDSDGIMLTGWHWEKDVWYYMDGNGAMTAESWKKINGDWYYFFADGKMATGWLTDKDGNYYYCTNQGRMLTGTQTIDGETYTFDESGLLVK